MEEEKKRYSDEELEEFRQIILDKLAVNRRDYEALPAVTTMALTTQLQLIINWRRAQKLCLRRRL